VIHKALAKPKRNGHGTSNKLKHKWGMNLEYKFEHKCQLV